MRNRRGRKKDRLLVGSCCAEYNGDILRRNVKMEKATIYDYARMCKAFRDDWCEGCPLNTDNNKMGVACSDVVTMYTDKANEIILNWCKEHPIKTRQDGFLKMFPKARIFDNKFVAICPSNLDDNIKCKNLGFSCDECRKEYWLAEVDENE